MSVGPTDLSNIPNSVTLEFQIEAGIKCPAQFNEDYAAAPKTPRRTNP